MKRILIFSHAMELGGAERVLLGLLEAMDYSRYEVDLFLMRHEGELLKDIPSQVRLLPEIPQYSCLAVPISRAIKKRQLGVALGRLCGKLLAARKRKQLSIRRENDIGIEYSHKYTACFMPPISEDVYDLAISFLTPHYFVIDKVKAKTKIAWIHTDYSAVAVDRESQVKMWAPYDRIVSISPKVSEAFIKVFPELADKLIELPQFMPTEYIRRKAEEEIAHEFRLSDSCVRLLSIGRFCFPKNFDNVPDICKKIRETGMNVKWFLIGYGGDEQIREKIAETGMEQYVIILGKKENPYPYIKACDLYVQPSRYEGMCVSVIEAQILGKPVAITNYPTACSQLEDGVDGVIVPMDNDGCAAGIAALLRDPKKMAVLNKNCEMRDYANCGEAEKLFALVP